MEPHRTPATAAPRAAALVAILVAVLAAAGIVATMLLAGPGGLAAGLTVALAAVQVVLLLTVREGAVWLRRFLLAWTGQAGLTHLVAGGPGVESALVYLGVGLVFAAAVVAGLALWRPAPEPDLELDTELEPDPDRRRGDTQPLPVADGDP